MAACRIDADAASCTIKAGEDAQRCPAPGLTNKPVRLWCSAAGTGAAQWRRLMCEPHILACTGLSLHEHRARTVASYQELRALAPHLPFIPVVQG